MSINLDNLREEYYKSDGGGFATKNSLYTTLSRNGVDKYYDYVEKSDGTWFGRIKSDLKDPNKLQQLKEKVEVEIKETPKDIKTNVRSAGGKMPKFRVRVLRTGDEANKGVPIDITANNTRGKIKFLPGQEVKLTRVQLNVLDDACLDSEISIPPESGIYQQLNPLVAAANEFPNYLPVWKHETNTIVCKKNEPKYIIQYLDNRPVEAA